MQVPIHLAGPAACVFQGGKAEGSVLATVVAGKDFSVGVIKTGGGDRPLFKAVIREGIIPVIAEGEAIAAKHVGCSFELLDKLLDNWWSRIGQTAYAGIPKLIVAEARNFPEVAAFYYENVISRGRALVGFALKRGMASGEFRTMDVETTIDVVIAPILMLLIWRYSMSCCQGIESNPQLYLQIHMDLLRHGLRRSEKESQV